MTDLAQLEQTLKAALHQRTFNKLAFYAPYPKQQEFHDLGATYRERLLMAGNQDGKTYCGSAEAAFHATGRYPDDWLGYRFTHAPVCWVAGITGEMVRNTPQKLLCGPPGVPSLLGTGFIPQELFIDKPTLARGVSDAYDSVAVKHVTGDPATIRFKSYRQGREHFQSESVDYIWLDEECEEDIYSECLARLVATNGILAMTFTPLKGMSKVVRRFLQPDDNVKRGVVRMAIEDALHIAPERRAEVIAAFPAHEREARTRGIPTLGSGAIFPVGRSTIEEPAIEDVPLHWKKIWGVDFGIDHPFAAVLLAWDTDNDVLHVLHAIRIKDGLPLQHAVPIKAIGANIPVAWPHDGLARSKGDGEVLKDAYRKQQLPMLPIHAQFEEGGISVEAGLMEMHDRMTTARFKVAAHLTQWWEEFHGYHRKDGLIVKDYDDLMDATRHAVMMRRFATARPLGAKVRKKRANDGMALGIDIPLG